MEEALFLLAIVLGTAVVLAVMAIAAFRRTGQHRRDLEVIYQQLNSVGERLAQLERTMAARPAAVQPAVALERPPIVQPPPVVEPPAVSEVEPPAVSEVEPPAVSVVEPPPVIHDDVAPPPPPFEVTPTAPNPLMQWLLQGNPLAKLGVVLLFFGLAYLLKFVSDRGMLSIELRLSGAALISIGLLVVGWRLRTRSPVYALTLQGGSIGALYLTSFAAFRVYALLPHEFVFALLVIICAASVALAVLQRAQSLALLASLGGYLAPVLLSTGGGNHVALFSYYALLSAGILAVSVWQAWRPLNLIGFAFTFGIGALWGADRYEPSLYASAQFFLILNLVMYGVIAVLMALRHGDSTQAAFVDGTLAFGAPLVGFGLQVGLTSHWEYGPAFSALGFGALYLPLAWLTLRRWPERAQRLTLSFLALGAGFVTLAIPLALSARWTSMAWALEGIGVLWAGRAQKQARMMWSGTGMLALAGASGWIAWMDGVNTPTFLMLSATLALSWLASAVLWRRAEDMAGHEVAAHFLLAGGVLVSIVLVAGGSERLLEAIGPSTMLALMWFAATSLIWQMLGSRLAWRAFELCAFLLWPFAGLVLAIQIDYLGHPLDAGWWNVGWLVTLAAAWQLLRRMRSTTTLAILPLLHASFGWLVFALGALEIQWRLEGAGWGADEWRFATMFLFCGGLMLAVSVCAKRQHWALVAYPRAYWFGALAPVLFAAGVLLASANLLDGRTPGLPYIPLLNILEEPALFVLLMAGVWYRGTRQITAAAVLGPAAFVIGALVVWWVNGILLRTLATIGGVSWSIDALWESAFIQTSMAILWTVAALVCMTVANRQARRSLWVAGAAALAVVVVKLFLVDSARGGGLGRAVAFIGVALLILLIGYVAPLPPREARQEGTSS